MSSQIDQDERRRRYFEDYKDRVDRHRAGSAFYEQRAIEFASSALKILTYLNGGGLLAIPAVVALFRTDPNNVKFQLLGTAAAFVSGLIFITISQACAFFVMARRSESEISFREEQAQLLKLVHYPGTADELATSSRDAQSQRENALNKLKRSDAWRIASLIFVWISLILFVVGCALGGWSVMASK
jgi:hypothetical protein